MTVNDMITECARRGVTATVKWTARGLALGLHLSDTNWLWGLIPAGDDQRVRFIDYLVSERSKRLLRKDS